VFAGVAAGGAAIDGSAAAGAVDEGTAAEGRESWAMTGQTQIATAKRITKYRGETIRIKAF